VKVHNTRNYESGLLVYKLQKNKNPSDLNKVTLKGHGVIRSPIREIKECQCRCNNFIYIPLSYCNKRLSIFNSNINSSHSNVPIQAAILLVPVEIDHLRK